MQALKFRLKGKYAFFKIPAVNSYYYFTYAQIHKVALLGIFGAILGYDGYQQMQKEDAKFSKKAEEEMNIYSKAVRDILERTTGAFINTDIPLARSVEPLEEVIDGLNKTVKKHHMKRLRKGKCTIGLGLVLSDLAMNYERVADHCSNIAVYMMQLNDTGLEEHSFTEQMDEKESAEFTKLENEFEQKYEID